MSGCKHYKSLERPQRYPVSFPYSKTIHRYGQSVLCMVLLLLFLVPIGVWGGDAGKPILGILMKQDDVTGAVSIVKVFPNTSAEAAGLASGDIVESIDGSHIYEIKEVNEAVGSRQIGDSLLITVNRKGKIREISVVLKSMPAGTVLTEMLKDEDEDIRWWAACMLGNAADKSAVPALTQILRNESEDTVVRKASADALGKIGDGYAIVALMELTIGEYLLDADYQVTIAIRDALEKITDKTGNTELEEMLENENDFVKLWAFNTLSSRGYEKITVPLMFKMLKNISNEDVKVEILRVPVITRSTIKNQMSSLMEALEDKDPWVRLYAAYILTALGDTICTATIDSVFRNETGNLRIIAGLFLIGDGENDLIPILLEETCESKSGVTKIFVIDWLESVHTPTVISFLCNMLKDGNSEIRAVAAKVLGKHADTTAVPALIKALNDDKAKVRVSVAQALAIIDDTSAIPALIKTLEDVNRYVKMQSAIVLAKLGDKASLPVLIELLQEKLVSKHNKKLLIEALGKVGDQKVVPVLVETLRKDADSEIKVAAAQALGEIGDKSSVSVLAQTLINENEYTIIRKAAADALGEIGDVSSVTELMKFVVPLSVSEIFGMFSQYIPFSGQYATGGIHGPVEKAVSAALEKIADRTGTTGLYDALKSRNEYVRVWAVFMLHERGEEIAFSTIPGICAGVEDHILQWLLYATLSAVSIDSPTKSELLRLLKHNVASIRVLATMKLMQMDEKISFSDMVNLLRRSKNPLTTIYLSQVILSDFVDVLDTALLKQTITDKNIWVRFAAVAKLTKLGDSVAIPILRDMIRNRQEDVRLIAALGLGMLEDTLSAIPVIIEGARSGTLLSTTNWAVQISATGVLGEVGAYKLATNQLRRLLVGDDLSVLFAKAFFMSSELARELLPSMLELLKTDDPRLRQQIVDIVGESRSYLATPALLEILEDEMHMGTRISIVNALGKIGDIRAVPVLVEVLQDGSGMLKICAMDALGEIGDSSAIPALIALLDESDEDVKVSAAKMLQKLGDRSGYAILIEHYKEQYALTSSIEKRGLTIDEIGKMKDRRAIPFLLSVMDDGHDLVFAGAAEVLHEICDTTDVQMLVELLMNGSSNGRKGAAYILETAGNEYAVQPLIEILDDKDGHLRSLACRTLGKIGDKSLIPQLLHKLRDEKVFVREAASQVLITLADKSALPALIRTLEDESKIVRENVAHALGNIGDNTACSVLVTALNDSSSSVRGAAVTALGQIDDKASIPQLLQKLKDKKVFVREAASEVLVTLCDKSAVSDLVKALEDENEIVKNNVAQALGNIGDNSAIPYLIKAAVETERSYVFDKVLDRIIDKSSVPILLRTLEDDDPRIRIKILGYLGKLRVNTTLPPVLKMLEDNDKNVRKAAVETAYKIGGKVVIPALIDVLRYDETAAVKIEIAKVFGRLLNRSTVPSLIETLGDEDSDVRHGAVWALHTIGDTSALYIQTLLKVLWRGENVDWYLRKIVDKPDIPQLVQLLDHESQNVRIAAAGLLAELGDTRSIPVLIDLLKDKRTDAAYYLGRLGSASAIPFLIGSLDDTNANIRESIVSALGEIGEKSVIQILMGVLKEESDEMVIDAAIGSIKKIIDEFKAPQLKPLLENDVSFIVRAHAVRVLGDWRAKSMVTDLIKLLEYDDYKIVREAAAQALGKIGDTTAVQTLQQAFEKDGPEVKMAAAEALLSLGMYMSDVPVLMSVARATRGEYRYNELRANIAETLGEIGDSSVTSVLLEIALSDPADEVRAEAVTALKKVVGLEAVPLFVALFEEDALLQKVASVVVRSSRYRLDALEDQYRFLASDVKKAGDHKCRIISALGNLGYARASKFLIDLLEIDYTVEVLSLVPNTLHPDTLRDSQFVAAIKGYNRNLKIAALISLGKIGDSLAVAALKKMCRQDGNSDLRLIAVKILAEMQSTYVLPYLVYVTADEESRTFQQLRSFYDLLDGIIYAKPNESMQELLRSLSMATDSKVEALILYLIGKIEYEQENDRKVLATLNQAIRHVDPVENTALTLMIYWLKVRCELNLGMFEECLDALGCVDSFNYYYVTNYERGIFDNCHELYSQYLRGELYRKRNEGDSALEVYNCILENMAREKTLYPRWKISEKKEKIIMRISAAKSDILLEMSKACADTAKAIADKYPARTRDEWESYELAYTNSIKLAIADGDYEDAQKTLEKYLLKRSQWLSKGREIKFSDPKRRQLFNEWQGRLENIEEIDRKIQELLREDEKDQELKRAARETKKIGEKDGDKKKKIKDEKDEEDGDDISQLSAERARLQRELKLFMVKLKDTHPDLAALLGAEPTEIVKIQERLSSDMALLQYLILQDTSYIFLIGSKTIDIRAIPVGRRELTKVVSCVSELLRDALSKQDTIRMLSSQMYEWLIEPVEGKLAGVKTLGILPSGVLHYLPFSVLGKKEGDEFEYLIDRYTLFEMNSTTLLGIAMTHGEVAELSSVLAFGDPDSSLPLSRYEAKKVRDIIGSGDVYLGEKARKETFLAGNFSGYGIHLATHAYLAPEGRLWDSYILFADDHLKLDEIWGLDLRRVPIVVLSACNTHVGNILGGDEVVSLANGFIYAGTGSVMGTLWHVSDMSTTEIMKNCYENMKKGKNKADALATAQRSLKDKPRFSHPYYWAPFVLIGDWR